MANYSQITDAKLQGRIRARYAQAIGALEALGFRGLVYCLEAEGPFSAVLKLPILLMAFNREVIVFPPPLRLAVGNALLFHTDPPAVALCMGLGVKLYSALPNQTLLVSSDFRTGAVPRPGARVVRLSPYPSIEAAWEAHRGRAEAAFGQSAFPPQRVGFGDYVEMSGREEDMAQYW